MTNEEFIRLHRLDDVRRLALSRAPEGVDMRWCLQQIEGWQVARRKLPQWAATEGLWYGPRLSMEQCSSEETAQYKRTQMERLMPAEDERASMADLTGGLGVDFSYLAPLFREATYVELQPELVRLARHNMPLLGLPHAAVADASHFAPLTAHFSLLFLDPARRDGAGRKTVAIEDCQPNLVEWQDKLLARAKYVMVKLSPMLDIREALRRLRGVSEVHVVSVRGECKELLFVMNGGADGVTYRCVNLGTDDDVVIMRNGEDEIMSKQEAPLHSLTSPPPQFLYEPNASVLKAGVQDVLCRRYGVGKLHPMSHLFVSAGLVPHFPGRRFRITGWSDFSKSGLKALLGNLRQANLTTRNFPTPVAQLRRQLRLAEGGDTYLFATTLAEGRHALIRCEKV
ncbi:MAG: hypothetical protein IJ197_02505 [Bacteroidaceae bacterium]|nr:hypothetical protein [Bacteroidaceae bacterium]